MITSRRSLITGLVSLIAAPAIVRVSSIMPVKLVQWDNYLLTKGDIYIDGMRIGAQGFGEFQIPVEEITVPMLVTFALGEMFEYNGDNYRVIA